MWYDDLGIITVGVQTGGENCGLESMYLDLKDAFDRHCRKSQSPTVAHYAVVFRIDGKFQKYGKEGIDYLRHDRRERYVRADTVIPLKVWKGKSLHALRDYFADQVRAALAACVERVRSNQGEVDDRRLFAEVDAALDEFRRIEYELPQNARKRKPRKPSPADRQAAEEFVARLAEAAPSHEDLAKFNITGKAAERYRRRYFLPPRKTPLGIDASNAVSALVNGWNTKTFDQAAGIRLTDSPQPRIQGLYLGDFQQNSVVLHSDGELALQHGLARGPVCRIAQSPLHFLQALAVAAKFGSDRDMNRIPRDDLRAAQAAAKRCATLAGGKPYLEFFRMMFWIDE